MTIGLWGLWMASDNECVAVAIRANYESQIVFANSGSISKTTGTDNHQLLSLANVLSKFSLES